VTIIDVSPLLMRRSQPILLEIWALQVKDWW
jgi:hypothetical protein